MCDSHLRTVPCRVVMIDSIIDPVKRWVYHDLRRSLRSWGPGKASGSFSPYMIISIGVKTTMCVSHLRSNPSRVVMVDSIIAPVRRWVYHDIRRSLRSCGPELASGSFSPYMTFLGLYGNRLFTITFDIHHQFTIYIASKSSFTSIFDIWSNPEWNTHEWFQERPLTFWDIISTYIS